MNLGIRSQWEVLQATVLNETTKVQRKKDQGLSLKMPSSVFFSPFKAHPFFYPGRPFSSSRKVTPNHASPSAEPALPALSSKSQALALKLPSASTTASL